MKPIKKAVAITGTYTDRNGQEKKQYCTCGKLFKRDDGSVVLKMDSVPVGFDGWLNFYDLEPKQDAAPAARRAPAPQDFDDDIPF